MHFVRIIGSLSPIPNQVFPTGPGIESWSQASLVQALFLIMLDVVEYDLTSGNVMLASEAIGAYLEHLES